MNLATQFIETGGRALITLYVALPVLAIVFSLIANAGWFKTALTVATVLTLIYLTAGYIILAQQLYQLGTGMGGLALFIFPALLALSILIALLCYTAARRLSTRQ